MDKLCSIIIRTKNEEAWITKCLEAVFEQTYKNIEVIIVDNCSTDTTIARCKKFNVKIVTINEFFPGKAINLGIEASKGDLICCLSAHCIPTNNLWLENLIKPLEDKSIAGCYGRQEPTSNSSDVDKRDLLLVFGLDSYIQSKDSFFHNANSAFRREIWNKYPFSNISTNIEDRIWGEEVISNGFKLAYVAESSVFHWHGIHHQLNPERAKNIVRILDTIPRLRTHNNLKNLKHTSYCIVPIKGTDVTYKNLPLIKKTINCLRKCKLINKIILSTDINNQIDLSDLLGLETVIRPSHLSSPQSSLEDVLQYTLASIESKGDYCDSISVAEIIYPFRENEVVDAMIQTMIDEPLDTIFASWREARATWFGEEGDLTMLGGTSWVIPSTERHGQIITSLIGYFTIIRPVNVRNKNIFQGQIKTHSLKNRNSSFVCRNQNEYDELSNLLLKL
ncbi:glycosyltransferase family 2 protein [Prochlorococcus marinus]|uniref:Glycosyltransferase 2-like domain-containing protein n=1 Tax=Prochlorococcus marinus XMU1408 TaxID=2213228 RepID=A0A318R5W6_PROMR|nr:glycosyltransferase family 2 protein [Prochlorococcus marinus]MBW3042890.1 hypothetical protein [Prochlorococcus marinus str. XMU1408]PYE00248.1 hypothetical protein DNJ73_09205 [Prochlorococcus marinus XMU1408]